MPDVNKFDRLRKVGFRIQECCSLCQSGCFSNGSAWGTCSEHAYEHRKHTGPPRGMSVHIIGWCPSFSISPSRLAKARLGAHEEFLP